MSEPKSVWASPRRLIRRAVFERDGHACRICGAEEPLTLDRIVPRAHGGRDDPDNLWTLCDQCNQDKGNARLEEWIGSRGESDHSPD